MTSQIHNFANEAVRALRILHVGSQPVGVFEDEIIAIAEWDDPRPIPFAPDSVLGIVSIEGRMFTVLDIGNAVGAEPGKHRGLIAALRGDEQLAIAADASEGPLEFRSSQIERSGDSSLRLMQSAVQYAGQQIPILDLRKLFSGAIRGRERRRRSP